MDILAYEKIAFHDGFRYIAGVDEAGRGPLAGPVVAAAVVFPVGCIISGISDSKKITQSQREKLFEEIYAFAISVGIGIVSTAWIDRFNIRQASLLAMAQAVRNLTPCPDYLLIDGNVPISSSIPQRPIVKGDLLSHSISAASIVAKVSRDRLMKEHHQTYPQFDFNTHKGYPTQAHRQKISDFGPCLLHRTTFKGVREFLRSSLE